MWSRASCERRRTQSTTSASTSVGLAVSRRVQRSHVCGIVHSADTRFRARAAGARYEEQQRQQASPPFSQPMNSRRPATSARSHDRMYAGISPRHSLFGIGESPRSTWLASAVATRECAAMSCSGTCALVQGVQRLRMYIHMYVVSFLHAAQQADMPSDQQLPQLRSVGVTNHCRYRAAMISPTWLRLKPKNHRGNRLGVLHSVRRTKMLVVRRLS